MYSRGSIIYSGKYVDDTWKLRPSYENSGDEIWKVRPNYGFRLPKITRFLTVRDDDMGKLIDLSSQTRWEKSVVQSDGSNNQEDFANCLFNIVLAAFFVSNPVTSDKNLQNSHIGQKRFEENI
ncbi:hypothetical protein JTB14_005758 [Gonioctena quinquepunctata]|nr:hypothetical protein JTB14_005758 [Gonioctena quinquepunctata]